MLVNVNCRPNALHPNLDKRDNVRYFEVFMDDTGECVLALSIDGKHEDAFMHMEFLRWSPKVFKQCKRDFEYLKVLLRGLGYIRIIGYTANIEDKKFAKFAAMFGFNPKSERVIRVIDMEL